MSGIGNAKPSIPNITGYPVIDTMIRNGIGYVAVALSGAIIAWLDAHGFSNAALGDWLPALIITGLIAAAAFVWSLVSKRLTMVAAVEHVLEAAQTGAVPRDVKALATPAQQQKIADAGK